MKRVALGAVIVQWVAAAIGFLVIESSRVVVQWDFPTGQPTNVFPKWAGLLAFPIFSTLLAAAYSRAIDAPGWPRIVRIGVLLILTLAQLAIVTLNA